MKTTRSTPLKPAIWMTGVLVWATVVGLFLRIPNWAGGILIGMSAASFAFYLAAYVHLLRNDPEALRHERLESEDAPAILGGGDYETALPPVGSREQR